MDTGAGGAVQVAPFHSGGSLKGFVVSGRWPDSTKEWAQLLMVAVRVASLPGLLATTTIFGVREELPDEPAPGTVGLVLAEGTVVGESAIPPGYFARPDATRTADAAPAVGDHAVAARMLGRRIGLRTAAGDPASGPGASRGMGRGRVGRHGHLDGEPRRRRPDQPSRYRHLGDAACGIRVFEAPSSNLETPITGTRTRVRKWRTRSGAAIVGSSAKGSSPQSSCRHTGVKPGRRTAPRGGRDLRRNVRTCRDHTARRAKRRKVSSCSPPHWSVSVSCSSPSSATSPS